MSDVDFDPETNGQTGLVKPTPLELYVSLYDKQVRADIDTELKRWDGLTHEALNAMQRETQALTQQVSVALSDSYTLRASLKQLSDEHELLAQAHQINASNLWWGVTLGVLTGLASLVSLLVLVMR